MYRLTEEEVSEIEKILAVGDEHVGFVNGEDVVKIAQILLNAFGGSDEAKAKAEAEAEAEAEAKKASVTAKKTKTSTPKKEVASK